jgi:hypothetical protein
MIRVGSKPRALSYMFNVVKKICHIVHNKNAVYLTLSHLVVVIPVKRDFFIPKHIFVQIL